MRRILPAALLVVTACSSGPATTESGAQAVYDGGTGPFDVSVTDETLAGETVTWYEPRGGNGLAVGWSHGFARSPENHATAAARAASWGFLVGVPELPSLSDQEVNAAFLTGDLRDAAIAKGAESVGYVGHSAGGLASLLAASRGDAWVLVGLDGTDVDGLGVAAAPSVTAPTLLLAGEPSACNAEGNGRAWTTSGGIRRLAVNAASHCDFESDTDSLCGSLCGAHDPERQDAVEAWTIAWLLEVAGADVGAWNDGGDEEASAVTGGVITPGW